MYGFQVQQVAAAKGLLPAACHLRAYTEESSKSTRQIWLKSSTVLKTIKNVAISSYRINCIPKLTLPYHSVNIHPCIWQSNTGNVSIYWMNVWLITFTERMYDWSHLNQKLTIYHTLFKCLHTITFIWFPCKLLRKLIGINSSYLFSRDTLLPHPNTISLCRKAKVVWKMQRTLSMHRHTLPSTSRMVNNNKNNKSIKKNVHMNYCNNHKPIHTSVSSMSSSELSSSELSSSSSLSRP